MKVKCIDDRFQLITKGKIYEVLRETEAVFEVVADNGDKLVYFKDWFEVVEEKYKVGMEVKCINGSFLITKGKVYEVLKETEDFFEVVADNGDKRAYLKDWFEVLEPRTIGGYREITRITEPFLFIYRDYIKTYSKEEYFNSHKNIEISAEQFIKQFGWHDLDQDTKDALDELENDRIKDEKEQAKDEKELRVIEPTEPKGKWDTAGFFQEVDDDTKILRYGKI